MPRGSDRKFTHLNNNLENSDLVFFMNILAGVKSQTGPNGDEIKCQFK